jgi:hypothetical protein
MGIVGCFCRKRGKAVTIFIFRAEGADVAGLERVVRDGREFFCGSSGKCQAAIWHRGELCYALVGELEEADLRDMARRAAAALDGKAEATEEKRAGLGCRGVCASAHTKRSAG